MCHNKLNRNLNNISLCRYDGLHHKILLSSLYFKMNKKSFITFLVIILSAYLKNKYIKSVKKSNEGIYLLNNCLVM